MLNAPTIAPATRASRLTQIERRSWFNESRINWGIILLLLILTGLRLFAIGQIELSPDEAYYHLWSQRLDWAYYSKGPGVALAMRLSTAIFGHHEFGIRFFAPILALGTGLILLSLTRRVCGNAAAIAGVFLAISTPIFQAGGLLMTIDALSIFFWSAAMLTTWHALHSRPRSSSYWASWLGTGIAIGFGFLSKYTNAMELLSVLLALIWVPEWRREFRRPGLYMMFAIVVLCAISPVWWNAQHDWTTVHHLSDHGKLNRPFGLHPGEFALFLIELAGVYSPLIFAGIAFAVIRAFALKGSDFPEKLTLTNRRFLLSAGLPLFIMYALLGLQTAGEPNWTAPSFISFGILAAAFWSNKIVKFRNRQVIFWCLAALIIGQILTLATLNTDMLRAMGIPLSYRADPSARLLGWQTTADVVYARQLEIEKLTKKPVTLIANKYQVAAELAFYLPNQAIKGDSLPVYVSLTKEPKNQFFYWSSFEMSTPAGSNTLFISDSKPRRPPPELEAKFQNWQMIGDYEIERRGLQLRSARIFLGENYLGSPNAQ